jgi:hypothetical protein
MLDYYRVSARFISALDLSCVFARFISFRLGRQLASQLAASAIALRAELTKSLLKNFCIGNTFKVKKCQQK